MFYIITHIFHFNTVNQTSKKKYIHEIIPFLFDPSIIIPTLLFVLRPNDYLSFLLQLLLDLEQMRF